MKARVKLYITKDKQGEVAYQLVSQSGWHEDLSRDELFDLLVQATSGLRYGKTDDLFQLKTG